MTTSDNTDLLFEAIRNADKDRVKELLKITDPNCKDSCGSHPLYVAASQDDPSLIEILLKAGSDPNKAVGFSGRNPIHVVCFRSAFRTVPVDFYVKSIGLLMKYGLSPIQKSARGYLPLDELTKMIPQGGQSKAHPDFVKFMQRVTQRAHQLENNVKVISIQE